MWFISKKINEKPATDFFIWAYSKILSDEEMANNKEKLKKLKEAFPLLKDVKQETFNENLSAVNIQLLEAAWTKYYYAKGIDIIDAVRFKTKLEHQIESKFPFYKELGGLLLSYNQAYGGYNMDEFFVSMIMGDKYVEACQKQPDKVREIISSMGAFFHETFDMAKKTINEHNILT